MPIRKTYLISIVSMMCLGFQWKQRWNIGMIQRHPDHLIDDALRLGYDGVLAVPTRGMTRNEKAVFLYENAWNPVNAFNEARHHTNGREGIPSQIEDWFVSPSIAECHNIERNLRARQIPRIGHRFIPGYNLVEVHPGLDKTPDEIVEMCQHCPPIRLVIDTHHLERDYREDEILQKPARKNKPSPLGTEPKHWINALVKLAPYTDVLHVHPTDDLEEFLEEPKNTMTGDLARTLVDLKRRETGAKLTLVAEFNPGKTGFFFDRRHSKAKRFLKIIQSL